MFYVCVPAVLRECFKTQKPVTDCSKLNHFSKPVMARLLWLTGMLRWYVEMICFGDVINEHENRVASLDYTRRRSLTILALKNRQYLWMRAAGETQNGLSKRSEACEGLDPSFLILRRRNPGARKWKIMLDWSPQPTATENNGEQSYRLWEWTQPITAVSPGRVRISGIWLHSCKTVSL